MIDQDKTKDELLVEIGLLRGNATRLGEEVARSHARADAAERRVAEMCRDLQMYAPRREGQSVQASIAEYAEERRAMLANERAICAALGADEIGAAYGAASRAGRRQRLALEALADIAALSGRIAHALKSTTETAEDQANTPADRVWLAAGKELQADESRKAKDAAE